MSLSDWKLEALGTGTALVNNITGQRYEYTHCSNIVRGVPHPGFIDPKIWELQKANLQFREGDIFVCTMSKCGTTLMEQILLLLLNGGNAEDLDPLSKNTLDRSRPGSVGKIWTEMAVVEGFAEMEAPKTPCSGEGKARMSMQEFDALPAPRVMKTHAPRQLFLAQGAKGKGLAPGVKVIYVTRNPFDACVSCYYHPKPGLSPATTGCPFDAFAQLYLSNRIEFGGWVNHVSSWYEEASCNPKQVFWVSYEDLVSEPSKWIKRVAEFLNLQVDEDGIQKVVEGSRFDNVKAKASKTLASEGKGNITHLRKGSVGDWRNHFTKALWAEFEGELLSQLQGFTTVSIDIGFDYDLGDGAWWRPQFLLPTPSKYDRYLNIGTNTGGDDDSKGSPHYDVIIVGLGPVGGVLANLLARTNRSVLVLESTDLDLSKTNPGAIHMDSNSMAILVQEIGLGKEWLDKTYPFPGGHVVGAYPELQWLGIGPKSSDKSNPIQGPLEAPRGPTGYSSKVFYQPELQRQLHAKVREASNVTLKTQQKVTAYDSISGGEAVLVKTERMKPSWHQTGSNEWVGANELAGLFEEFTCSYLIGCDGAHSTIRELLLKSVPQEGFEKEKDDGKLCAPRAAAKTHGGDKSESSIDQIPITLASGECDDLWLVIDLELHNESLVGTKLPHLAQQICDPKRPATLIPGSRVWGEKRRMDTTETFTSESTKAGGRPGRHFRWEFLIDPEVDDPDKMVQASTVFELLAPWVSPGDVSIVHACTYQGRCSDARVWNDGRVFLVGDAAHTSPRFFGQGCNQGIQDAMNLAWKLDFVLGGAHDNTLKTYEIERRPIARHMTNRAIDNGVKMNALFKAARRGSEEFDATVKQLADKDKSATYGHESGTWGDPMLPATKGPLTWMPLAFTEARANYVGRILPQPVVNTKQGPYMLYEHMGPGFCLVYSDVFTNICSDGAARSFKSIGGKMLPVSVCNNGGAQFFLGGLFKTFCAVMVRPDRVVFGVVKKEKEVDAMIDSLVDFLKFRFDDGQLATRTRTGQLERRIYYATPQDQDDKDKDAGLMRDDMNIMGLALITVNLLQTFLSYFAEFHADTVREEKGVESPMDFPLVTAVWGNLFNGGSGGFAVAIVIKSWGMIRSTWWSASESCSPLAWASIFQRRCALCYFISIVVEAIVTSGLMHSIGHRVWGLDFFANGWVEFIFHMGYTLNTVISTFFLLGWLGDYVLGTPEAKALFSRKVYIWEVVLAAVIAIFTGFFSLIILPYDPIPADFDHYGHVDDGGIKVLKVVQGSVQPMIESVCMFIEVILLFVLYRFWRALDQAALTSWHRVCYKCFALGGFVPLLTNWIHFRAHDVLVHDVQKAFDWKHSEHIAAIRILFHLPGWCIAIPRFHMFRRLTEEKAGQAMRSIWDVLCPGGSLFPFCMIFIFRASDGMTLALLPSFYQDDYSDSTNFYVDVTKDTWIAVTVLAMFAGNFLGSILLGKLMQAKGFNFSYTVLLVLFGISFPLHMLPHTKATLLVLRFVSSFMFPAPVVLSRVTQTTMQGKYEGRIRYAPMIIGLIWFNQGFAFGSAITASQKYTTWNVFFTSAATLGILSWMLLASFLWCNWGQICALKAGAGVVKVGAGADVSARIHEVDTTLLAPPMKIGSQTFSHVRTVSFLNGLSFSTHVALLGINLTNLLTIDKYEYSCVVSSLGTVSTILLLVIFHTLSRYRTQTNMMVALYGHLFATIVLSIPQVYQLEKMTSTVVVVISYAIIFLSFYVTNLSCEVTLKEECPRAAISSQMGFLKASLNFGKVVGTTAVIVFRRVHDSLPLWIVASALFLGISTLQARSILCRVRAEDKAD